MIQSASRDAKPRDAGFIRFLGEFLDDSLTRRPVGYKSSHRPTGRITVQSRSAAKHSRANQNRLVQASGQLAHTRLRFTDGEKHPNGNNNSRPKTIDTPNPTILRMKYSS